MTIQNNQGVEIYKGYEIKTTPNGDYFTSLIYKNGVFVAGTFSNPSIEKSSIEKAKTKIENRINNG